MKKYAAFAASVAISAATLVGCGGDDDFCNKAEDLSGSEMPSADELQELADSAPDDIKDDVQTIVDASSDPANADTDAISEAAANVDEWGQENCE